MQKVFSPFNNEVVGEIPVLNASELEAAKNEALSFFTDHNKRLGKDQILSILEKAVKICQDEREELIKLAASEGGKPYKDSAVEIDRGIDGIKIAIATLRSMHGTEIPMGINASSKNKLAFTTKEPLGLVLSISAFNHPFNLAVHQVIPAIAVGAPVLIKPATATPLSAFRLVDILERSGLPKGFAKAFLAPREAMNALISSQDIAYLSFIGSAEVGFDLQKQLPAGARAALEHGGLAPVIVDKGEDVKALSTVLAKGGFYHSGQVCVSVQRIYAHKSLAKELATELANEAQKLVVGDPLNPSTDLGPLIDPNEITRIDALVKDALNNGANALCGAKSLPNNCYAPTVLLNPSEKARISHEEVFGPVICIYEYEDINEAINKANSLPVVFQSSIFSSNIDTCMYAARRLHATAVMINESTTFRVDWMPFGGQKRSGLGLGGINYSMQDMVNEKLIVIKSKGL